MAGPHFSRLTSGAQSRIITGFPWSEKTMFGNIGLPEMMIIMVVALLVFGPKKLPEIGRSVGKAMREFKKSTEEIKDRFEEQIRADDFKAIQDDIKKDLKDIKDVTTDEEGKKIT
jgi:sec-independent protein translocase protein TatA